MQLRQGKQSRRVDAETATSLLREGASHHGEAADPLSGVLIRGSRDAESGFHIDVGWTWSKDGTEKKV